jgi:hypothetical protein
VDASRTERSVDPSADEKQKPAQRLNELARASKVASQLGTMSMSGRRAQPRSERMAMSLAPPRSVPSGLHVQLGRARILPNMQEEARAWMGMLNDRLEEYAFSGSLGLEKEHVVLQGILHA